MLKIDIGNEEINFLRKLPKVNPMETSAIASANENYRHESFCESVWHVVDVPSKLCIPKPYP